MIIEPQCPRCERSATMKDVEAWGVDGPTWIYWCPYCNLKWESWTWPCLERYPKDKCPKFSEIF